jgi:lipoprotein NlpI
VRGIDYYAKRDYDRAVADFNKTIELEPRFAITYANRGLTYYAKQNYDNV